MGEYKRTASGKELIERLTEMFDKFKDPTKPKFYILIKDPEVAAWWIDTYGDGSEEHPFKEPVHDLKGGVMTIQELEDKIKKAEEFQERNPMFKDNGIQLMTNRNCKGKRFRLAPGIYGEIMFWGGTSGGTIFVLKLDAAKKYLEMVRKQ